MSGVNKVILVGHLGRDPEMRRTNAGDPVVTFSIATSDTWRDKASGERKERTEWHNIVIYNEGLTKVADAYLKKGSRCYIEGKIRTRTYTDRDGAERKTTEIVLERFNGELVLLDSAPRAAPDADSYGKVSAKPTPAQLDDPREAMGAPAKRTADFINDDIPF
jgi:single-strand DNA-binding protein